jgi:hypothetical protein
MACCRIETVVDGASFWVGMGITTLLLAGIALSSNALLLSYIPQLKIIPTHLFEEASGSAVSIILGFYSRKNFNNSYFKFRICTKTVKSKRIKIHYK